MVSSEQELTHLDSQLLLLIDALAPLVVAILAEPEAPGVAEAVAPPTNTFWEGPEGASERGGEEGAEDDDEVARSLHGSHFALCKKGRKDVGLKPREIGDEPERDADDPVDPGAGPVLCASTERSPTARDGGGDLDDRHARVSSNE